MTNPNDSVFPESELLEGGTVTTVSGLTKREYFAAMALNGLLSQEDDYHRLADIKAVEFADALIAALNEEGQANG